MMANQGHYAPGIQLAQNPYRQGCCVDVGFIQPSGSYFEQWWTFRWRQPLSNHHAATEIGILEDSVDP